MENLMENLLEVAPMPTPTIENITKDGEVRRFGVNHPQLEKADHNYFIMNQGDKITLSFHDFVPLGNGNYFLISKGYYKIYE